MSAEPTPYGSPAKRGAYRCEDCGYELQVGPVRSMPPCPRTRDVPHEANAWRRRGHGAALALSLGVVALGVGAWVYAAGARRAAEQAREIAAEGRRLAEYGLDRAEYGVRELRSSLGR